LKVAEDWEGRISRGIAFQIAGAEQRKERKPKSMLDGVGTEIELQEQIEVREGWLGLTTER
jgi:hypothetical protein